MRSPSPVGIRCDAERAVAARPFAAARRRGLVLLAVFVGIACVPGDSARAADEIVGSARDADTNEPIADAWIFETHRRPGSGADVLHVDRARITRTDAHGRFSFESEPRGFAIGRRYPPQYQFYHPSYGLVRARADEDGRSVRFRPSLRDAHLRQRDAFEFCGQPAHDPMAEKMVELACPPARTHRFPDGAPRTRGSLDERGRRDGEWIFYREDGSVIARGTYRQGAAIGAWQFEAPSADAVRSD